jgi:hypothetical protein
VPRTLRNPFVVQFFLITIEVRNNRDLQAEPRGHRCKQQDKRDPATNERPESEVEEDSHERGFATTRAANMQSASVNFRTSSSKAESRACDKGDDEPS